MATLPRELRTHLSERFRGDGWKILRNSMKRFYLERWTTSDTKQSIHLWPLLGPRDLGSPTKFTMQCSISVRFEQIEALIAAITLQGTTPPPSVLPGSSCDVFLSRFGNDGNMDNAGYIFDTAECLKSQAAKFYDFFSDVLTPFLTTHAGADVLLADAAPGHEPMTVAWLTRRMLKFALNGNRDRAADLAARIEREAPTSLTEGVRKLQEMAARNGNVFMFNPDKLRYDLYPDWLEFCSVKKYVQAIH